MSATGEPLTPILSPCGEREPELTGETTSGSTNPLPARGEREPSGSEADEGRRDGQAQALAERVGERMFASDRASRALGMHLAAIGPGRAEMTMTVRDDMVNGHAICHGGYIFLLADSTFAFACNSYNRNTVAQGCAIDYLAPARAGDVLRATAVERARTGRTGVYDIDVCNQDARAIALFRGKSYRIDGHVVDEPS
jgi:acyl-CoA thioesterase